jgi:HEAT repeat protein
MAPPARASAPLLVTSAPIAAVAVSELLTEAAPSPAFAPRQERAPEAILPAPPGLAGSNALEWSLAQARASLKQNTHDREALVSVILDYGRRTFEYVASFAVMRGAAVGWDGRGDVDVEALRQVAIPLDAASVFRTVALTRGSYVGPLPPDALSQHYLALLSRSPRTVFMWPVEVQSRLVAILYGDCGARPVSQRRLADFILFCQDLPSAFHELILHRKQNPQVAQTLTVPTESMPSWGESGAPSGSEWHEPPPPPPAHAEGDAEWFTGLITLLTGPDPSERSMAMLELMKTPDASAQALTYAFPGPTGWSRLPVVELPEPDELGPVPGALARLAQAGASALAPLLDSSDSDTRYLALLTAGSLRYPDVVGGVLRGLFDLEPDISSAARAAAASLKYLPHFQHRMSELRQELLSSDALRRSLAARALGVLHDRESIDSLINLTGSEDELCAQSAADALKELTRAGYGTNPAGWAQWWARARDRRRIEWLVDALEAEDFDLRLSAIEELSRTFGDNFGFFADGPEAEREGAVARWLGTIAERPDFDL